MKRKDQGLDLFAWAAARPAETTARAECNDPPAEKPAVEPRPRRARKNAQTSAEVVDFLEVRPTLGRWILARRTELELAMNDFDKRAGLMPPTPILPFKREA